MEYITAGALIMRVGTEVHYTAIITVIIVGD